eukprot:jgi/Galph1/2011/GphlegSOOS_G673.1
MEDTVKWNMVEERIPVKNLKKIFRLLAKDSFAQEYFQDHSVPLSLLKMKSVCRDEDLRAKISSTLTALEKDPSKIEQTLKNLQVHGDKESMLLDSHKQIDIARACLPFIATHLKAKYPKKTAIQKHIGKVVDLSHPEDWYPLARQYPKKVILHIGPTNSGKTYEALKCLREADSGIYCGPLRLLAWEIHDRLNRGDDTHPSVACNLLTGQERVEIPNARHLSCTVEMTPLQKRYQVGVVDEVQLLGDNERAWAWTRAILGLSVNELHLCGDPSSETIVRQLVERTGDDLSVKYYHRLSLLDIEDKCLSSSKQLRPGDCIIAFSKPELFRWKSEIERETSYKCSLIYGGLPPEVRHQQSHLFNSLNNNDRVLVATDAVGMGLNLNIRRVLFSSLQKFDGKEMRPLSVSQIRQIGGRAGRFGSLFPDGLITTMKLEDLEYVQQAYSYDLPVISQAGLFPSAEMVQSLAEQYQHMKFSALWKEISKRAHVGGTFFLCSLDEVKARSEIIEDLPLSIETKYLLCMSPLDLDNHRQSLAFAEFARELAFEGYVRITRAMSKVYPAESLRELNHVESTYKILDLYLWLSNRFPDAFVEVEKAKSAPTSSYGQYRLDEFIQSPNILAKLSLASQELTDDNGNSLKTEKEERQIGSLCGYKQQTTQDEEVNYCTPQDQAILQSSSCPPSSPSPKRMPKSFYDSQSTQETGTQQSQKSEIRMTTFLNSQDSSLSSQNGIQMHYNRYMTDIESYYPRHRGEEGGRKRTRLYNEIEREPRKCIKNPYIDRHHEVEESEGNGSILSRRITRIGVETLSCRYIQDFEELAILGKGEKGVVVKARHRIDGGIYAVKISKKLLVGNAAQHEALREVQILVALGSHPNIIQYFSSWLENDDKMMYIQTEYCHEGALSRMIGKPPPSSEILFRMMGDICRALSFIHSKGIVHMDIKPDNVLCSNNTYKLGDFGLACFADRSDFMGQEGDSRYLCKSMLNTSTANFKAADIFSLGAMMLEIAIGKCLPKSGEEWHKIRNSEIDSQLLQHSCGSRLSALIRWCLSPDPTKRPRAEELLTRFEPNIERVFEMEQLLLQQKTIQKELEQTLVSKQERIKRLEDTLREICATQE